MVTSASRESYWPDSSVRTSSSSISFFGGLGPGRLVVLALGQLEHHPRVVQPPHQGVQPGQVALDVGQPARHRLRVLLVRPQVGVGGLLAQARGFAAQRVRIENRRYAVKRRRQSRDLISGIGSCHGGQPMRGGVLRRMSA
jgi:hypothetical protein